MVIRLASASKEFLTKPRMTAFSVVMVAEDLICAMVSSGRRKMAPEDCGEETLAPNVIVEDWMGVQLLLLMPMRAARSSFFSIVQVCVFAT
jgi:hypothetical protein